MIFSKELNVHNEALSHADFHHMMQNWDMAERAVLLSLMASLKENFKIQITGSIATPENGYCHSLSANIHAFSPAEMDIISQKLDTRKRGRYKHVFTRETSKAGIPYKA